jgi:hypothetical protein
VQFEDSADLALVGQSFGAAWPATWSVTGNVGRVEISAETHAVIREILSLPPVPASFTPFAIEIDLTTLAATSPTATGAYGNGTMSFGFTTGVLDTEATGGFVGPDTPPLFCTSQQQIDDACLFVPLFCGQVCTIVPGSRYAPASGLANLIGSEEQVGCDGQPCGTPVVLFAPQGDVRLSEVADKRGPALGPHGLAALAALLAICAGRRCGALQKRRTPQLVACGLPETLPGSVALVSHPR